MKSEIEIIDDFIADQNIRKNSARQYTWNLKRWYRWLRRHGIDYTAFKRKDIVSYIHEMQEATYSTLTIASYVQSIKLLVRWLVSNDLMKYDVAAAIRVNKEYDTWRKSALSPEQVHSLLQAMPKQSLVDKRNRAIVYLMLTTGLRVVEVSRLSITDMNHTDQMGYYILALRKGRSTKKPVPISEQCFELIQEYLTRRPVLYNDQHPLFTSHSWSTLHNQPLSTNAISSMVKGYLNHIGCTGSMYTAHSLRHTAAAMTLSIEGANDSDLQRFMSHTNYQTSQLYIEQQKQSELFRKRFTDKLAERLPVSI